MNTDNYRKAKEHLNKAMQLSRDSNIEGACEEFKKAVNCNSSYEEAYFEWGIVLLKNGKKAEAIGKFANAFEVDSSQTTNMLNRLKSLRDLRWDDASIKKIQQVIDGINEQSHERIKDSSLMQWESFLLAELAKNYCDEGIELSKGSKFKNAYEEFKRAINCDLNYYKAYFEWGKALLKNGEKEKAIDKFLEVFKIDKSQIPNMLKDLQSLQDLRWNRASIKKFQQAIDGIDEQNYKNIKDPSLTQWKSLLTQQAEKHFSKALQLSASSRFEDAYKEFEEVVIYDKNYANVYFEWGKVLLKDSKQEKAINKFLKAFEVDSIHITNMLINLQPLQNLKWDEESISKFQQAINNSNSSDKNKAKIYYHWGFLLSQLKFSDKSIEQQKKSVDLDPHMEEYKNWKTWSREIAIINFPNEPIQEYEKALEQHRKSAEAYTEWANLFRCQSRFEKARDLYKTALEINLTCQTAHEWLLYCLLKIHDVPPIAGKANELIEYTPDNEKAYNQLICAANLERNFDKAIEIAKEASEKRIDWWHIKINWARALYKNGKNNEAIKTYETLLKNTSTIDKPDQALIYYFYGNLLLDSKCYEEAGKKFDEAIKLDPDCVYAYHNLASILFEIQGQYEEASTKWDDALKVYERLYETALARAVDQGKEVDSHEFYYHAQVLQAIKGNKEKAGKILIEGLKFNPEDTLILSGLASLEWEKKGECLKPGTDNAKEKSACHWRAIDYFKQAERLLKKRLDRFEIYDDLIEIANLYFIVDNYKESCKFYQAALRHKDAALPYAKLGIIQLRLKTPEAAILLLEKSRELNPDELDVKSSLAEAYLRAEKLEEADKYYREVLDIAPNHVQSLIGLGETCTAWGDKKETDRYSEAIDFFKKALKIAENERMRSKYLTKPEKAKVNYLLGYATVQRYENSKLHHQDSELGTALEYFKTCKELNPSYQKVARAIEKLEKRSQPLTEIRWGQRIIFGLSGLVFLLAQLFFCAPALLTPPYWIISESSLKSLEKNLNSSEIKLLKIEQLKDKEFSSPEATSVLLKIDTQISDKERMVEVKDLIKNSTIRKPSYSMIDATSYSALTFGSLLFMVVGLYLPQVLKLSVAGISLEKSTLDQSQTGGSMGIAK